MTDVAYSNFVDKGAKALIHAGTGNGQCRTVWCPLCGAAQERRAHHPLVACDRCGFVIRNAEQPDDKYDWSSRTTSTRRSAHPRGRALTKTQDSKSCSASSGVLIRARVRVIVGTPASRPSSSEKARPRKEDRAFSLAAANCAACIGIARAVVVEMRHCHRSVLSA